ncbi:MAG: TonB family protein [Spirochaetes bacterium]|nr:TonB family protein [Spirochaetota bacterium]
MEFKFYSRDYSPKWVLFFVVSVLIHILAIMLIFLYFSDTNLELSVKEVNIKFISTQRPETSRSLSDVQQIQTTKKNISKDEVDDIVYEIVSPKISKSLSDASDTSDLAKPTKEITVSDRKIGSELKRYERASEQTPSSIKGSKEGEISKDVDENELLSGKPTPLPSSKGSTTDSISGNISWIKGGPRKVVEWYSPEIPPNILRKQTEIILTFYIEPSGFVSRVEVLKTSGEPLVDEIVLKTMRRIRFNPANFSTVANVSITITPK